MKTLKTIVQEKLIINKNIKTPNNYNKIFGDGEVKRFGACKFPFEDIIESYQKDEIVDTFRRKYNIKLDTNVFFMIGRGAHPGDMKEPTQEFLKAKEKFDHMESLTDWGRDVNIRVYILKNYYDYKELLVIQCQNWANDIHETYWYIKI